MGCEGLSSVSVHPVQPWPESQNTGGLLGDVTALAISGATERGNPILAAGGTGDVLTGFIGGFLAQGLPPWEATCMAVFLHGLAADTLADEENIQAGMLASELADILPAVISEIMTDEEE